MSNISVVGAGSWGTAVATLLCDNNHKVNLWVHSPDKCKEMSYNRVNPLLPELIIPENVYFTDDIKECCSGDIIILATPSHAIREIAKKMEPFIKDNQIILSISKGIEEDSCLTISQIIKYELPNCIVAVMSGPSHAEEVSRRLPTTNVVACKNIQIAEYIQNIIMNERFRVYTNSDVLGVELGGSIKNVIALCCGIIDGVGLGDNTKAALMTRGIAEISRLGVALGAKSETFSGLSGVGDLIVTCTSMHSRNRRAGILIGKGKNIEDAQKEVNMVVEGIRTCRAVKQLADMHNVEMPIVNAAYDVLFNKMSVKEAISELMGRSKKQESEIEFLRN